MSKTKQIAVTLQAYKAAQLAKEARKARGIPATITGIASEALLKLCEAKR